MEGFLYKGKYHLRYEAEHGSGVDSINKTTQRQEIFYHEFSRRNFLQKSLNHSVRYSGSSLWKRG